MNWHSEEIEELVRRALAEDIGDGDATTAATVRPGRPARASILARQTLVCAGLPIAETVFRALLTGERTALNFLGHLCGVATLTRRFVEQLVGTRARIRDTRKTTPGFRALEKYAVKTGGGTNNRFGLYDAILLKENHVALAGGMKEAVD